VISRVALIAAVLAISCSLSTVAGASSCGDIDNNDVGPNIGDLTYLVGYLFGGGPVPADLTAANVDGIGSLDVSDLVYLVSFLFSGGPEPVCAPVAALTYPVVGTVQSICYDTLAAITCPLSGESFHG